VTITDPAGRIEYVNRAFEKMTGYSRSEVIGENPRVLKSGLHPDSFYRELWQTITAGATWSREFTNRRRDGTLYDVEQTISPVRDASGVTVAYVGIQSDISERKRAEAALRRAHAEAVETSELKSGFLAAVSHELRTPLNAILGYAELLRESPPTMPLGQAFGDIDRIEEAGRGLLKRIDDLLDISRLEAGTLHLELSPCDVTQVLAAAAGAVRPLMERNGNTFESVVESGIGRAVADASRLRQILDTLLENAATLTTGGSVSLTARRNGGPDGPRIVIEIADTGPGMDEAQMKRLFTPFSQADVSATRRHGGLGLSLAISHRLCTIMGLVLSVKSETGVGSRFTLSLPAEGT
jgi:PAS domain S-box-containing protein